MSLRRQFILSLVTFSVALAAVGGYLAWREANRALEAELDLRASWVAGAAARTGLQASLLVGLQPGFEDTQGWKATHAQLRELLFYVREAYVLRRDNTAIVSSFPADSVPIGASLAQFDLYRQELEEAREVGYATTISFEVGGNFFKWGFAELENSGLVLAVLMPADYLVPLDRLQRNLVAGSFLAAVLAALLAALLAAGVIEPMERLSRVALRIQRGHMEEPVAEEAVLEVGRLARAMELMRLGILERDERLRLMLAQVAHEIRNPLGGLELFAAAAAETEDAGERQRLLTRVRDEVSALNEIIDDFLTFARPMTPTRETTDLRKPVREAADLVRAELEERGGSLTVTLPEKPLLAKVDAGHTKRAVLNLLRNAAQASDYVRLGAGLENGEVMIAVSDDGSGVPQDMQGRVFDPFVTDKAQGAGLGLAIVRKVVEAHGGRVELADPGDANGGRGAEFRIYFGSLDDPPPLAAAGD